MLPVFVFVTQLVKPFIPLNATGAGSLVTRKDDARLSRPGEPTRVETPFDAVEI